MSGQIFVISNIHWKIFWIQLGEMNIKPQVREKLLQLERSCFRANKKDN